MAVTLVTMPVMTRPTAIPTTAPVLSPLPEVGARVTGDGAYVFPVSGVRGVVVPEPGALSRLGPGTGRPEDSWKAELLSGGSAQDSRGL